MKKDYNSPEFLKVELIEDVLLKSDSENLGPDNTDDGFDKEDPNGLGAD